MGLGGWGADGVVRCSFSGGRIRTERGIAHVCVRWVGEVGVGVGFVLGGASSSSGSHTSEAIQLRAFSLLAWTVRVRVMSSWPRRCIVGYGIGAAEVRTIPLRVALHNNTALFSEVRDWAKD